MKRYRRALSLLLCLLMLLSLIPAAAFAGEDSGEDFPPEYVQEESDNDHENNEDEGENDPDLGNELGDGDGPDSGNGSGNDDDPDSGNGSGNDDDPDSASGSGNDDDPDSGNGSGNNDAPDSASGSEDGDDPDLTDNLTNGGDDFFSMDMTAAFAADSADNEEDGEELTEEEEELVCVEFICDPEDTIITVYACAAGEFGVDGPTVALDENGEPVVIKSEEDGTYLLMPGYYLYDASTDGYESENAVPFEVSTGESQEIIVLLNALAAESFSVGEEALDIPLTLTPVFASSHMRVSSINSLNNSISDESDLEQPELTSEKEIDRIVPELTKGADNPDFSLENEVAFAASAESIVDIGVYGTLTWKLDSSGTLTISGTGPMKEFEDATSITNAEAWRVPAIRKSINRIVINPGITSIAKWAFFLCENLESVTLSDGLIQIEHSAFLACDMLKKITVPGTVTELMGAIDSPQLRSAGPIGSGCDIEYGWNTEIPEYAFYQCSNLTNVIIPASITEIGGAAFYSLNNLQNVYYGGSAGQWATIDIGTDNNPLLNANIHYSSSGPANYTVSYNANGGSGAPASQTKTQGITLTLSSTQPTRSSVSAGSYTVYTFNNWNTASNGSGTSYNPGGSYSTDANATLYAQWNSNTTTAAVTLPTPTRSGYSFQGWATSSSASSGVTGSYTPSGNVKLYATWKANAYTVSYNANGGSGAPEGQTKTQGIALTLSSTQPIRSSVSAGSYTVTLDANVTRSTTGTPHRMAAERVTTPAGAIRQTQTRRCTLSGTAAQMHRLLRFPHRPSAATASRAGPRAAAQAQVSPAAIPRAGMSRYMRYGSRRRPTLSLTMPTAAAARPRVRPRCRESL